MAENRKFELFMCSLGNGLTVCNKAVWQHGDYKQIAHIEPWGKIKWYVNPETYVPGLALLRIEHNARAMRSNWKHMVNSMPLARQYEYLLNLMPISSMLEVFNMDCTMEEKCEHMKTVLCK